MQYPTLYYSVEGSYTPLGGRQKLKRHVSSGNIRGGVGRKAPKVAQKEGMGYYIRENIEKSEGSAMYENHHPRVSFFHLVGGVVAEGI